MLQQQSGKFGQAMIHTCTWQDVAIAIPNVVSCAAEVYSQDRIWYLDLPNSNKC